jgi:pimeloyl-ACP methyl ester carboxylesterase
MTIYRRDVTDDATVVLVHGAWHGAWCWERVVALLDEHHVPTVAVDLPGHGADRRPLADLHGDAAHVRDVVAAINGPVVLVGHSYGGAVITEAGTAENVSELVYICAFAIHEDESCASAGTAEPEVATITHKGRPSLGKAMQTDDGIATLDPDLAPACLYNQCDPEAVAWALSRLGPESMTGLAQSPSEVAWRTKPSTYAVCIDDQGVHPDLQRVLARRCTTSVEWPTDHSPFLCRPDLVADLLADLAHRG